jgi:hypothetical protein
MGIDFIDAMAVAVQAGVPVLLEGPPGDAKTSIVDAVLGKLCAAHETIVLAVREPADVGGYPVDTPDGMTLKPTRWAYRLSRVTAARAVESPSGPDSLRRVGVFLDELTSAPPATRAAALRGIVEGVWGEIKIPNLSIVAAQNPPELAEAGYQLSAAMSNRFVHLKWELPISEWSMAMVMGFKSPEVPQLPADWEKHLAPMQALVSAFAQRVPSAIRDVPKDPTLQSGPWPSLRTWTYATRLLAACESIDHPLIPATAELWKLPLLLLTGCVGEGAAQEFVQWATDLDLVNPEVILENPRRPLPERQDQLYATLSAVVSVVLRKNTVERWHQAWDFLGFVAKSGFGDIAAPAAKMLTLNRPSQSVSAPAGIDYFAPMLRAAGLTK